MTDVPRGQLYIGEQIDAAAHSHDGKPVVLAASDFTTHGVIVGMTGSGKTGLGVVLHRGGAARRRPDAAHRPQGRPHEPLPDVPRARGRRLPPVDQRRRRAAGRARRPTRSPSSRRPRGGRPRRLGHRARAHRRAAQTPSASRSTRPGSTAGVPLNLVGSLAGAGRRDRPRDRARRDRGLRVGPARPRRHRRATRSRAASTSCCRTSSPPRGAQGATSTSPTLVGQVQQPPMRKLGVFELDTFFPPADRTALAMKLNGLLASPSFAAWAEGAPLDIESMLLHDRRRQAARGDRHDRAPVRRGAPVRRRRSSSSKLVTWMRRQTGTTDLRALVYMDEVAGFAAAHRRRRRRRSRSCTLLKQARAFGVGLVLSTQNPVDLDYKAISNAGTWMVGRLQTEQDKARLLDGMSRGSRRRRHRRRRCDDQRPRQAGVRAEARGGRRADRVHRPAGRWPTSAARSRASRSRSLTPHEASTSAGALPPPPPGVAAASLPPPTAATATPAADRVTRRTEGRGRHLRPLPRPCRSMGSPGRSRRRRHAPRRRRGCARVSMVFDDDKAGFARGRRSGRRCLCPLPTRARSDRGGRSRLRRAQPRHNGSIGHAVRALRRAHRHEDLLVVAATQPRRPARAHADDADQSQREAASCTRASERHPSSSWLGARRPQTRSPIRSSHPFVTSTHRAMRGAHAALAAARGQGRGAGGAGEGGAQRRRGRRRRRLARWVPRREGERPLDESVHISQPRPGIDGREAVGERSNRAEEKQDTLANLEQEFEADLAAVHAEAEAAAAAIDTLQVPLEKTDVKVVDIALVWVPRA